MSQALFRTSCENASRQNLVAAPATAVGRQFLEANQFGHQRTDDRAVPRDACLLCRTSATNVAS